MLEFLDDLGSQLLPQLIAQLVFDELFEQRDLLVLTLGHA